MLDLKAHHSPQDKRKTAVYSFRFIPEISSRDLLRTAIYSLFFKRILTHVNLKVFHVSV